MWRNDEQQQLGATQSWALSPPAEQKWTIPGISDAGALFGMGRGGLGTEAGERALSNGHRRICCIPFTIWKEPMQCQVLFRVTVLKMPLRKSLVQISLCL